MTSYANQTFERNETESNMCGFTLQNSQTGNVIAEVMDRIPNVTVTYLPSMIRVDGNGRFDVIYDDLAEALGEDPDDLGFPDLEEVISTHYGRMVNVDDRTIMFSHPEEAAEYLGFDLKPVR